MRQSILLLIVFLTFQFTSACSIFSCFRSGKILVGSNEDGDYPFSYIRTVPAGNNSYGAIFFGTSDMQAQSGVNEHGLFFDYSALPPGEIDESKIKTIEIADNDCTSYSQLLHSCKNVPEFLEALKSKPYRILTSQLLIADAEGNSAIINAQDIIINTGDFQISTNFNACNAIEGNYECSRYDQIYATLSSNSDISVALFQNILDDVHVEGQVATQYSNVYDLKEGKIYMNFFHNFKETVVLDVKAELQKGYKIRPLDQFFLHPNFITEHTLKNHPEYYRELLVNEFSKNGYDRGIELYEYLREQNPTKTKKLNEGLISSPFSLTSRARAEFDGQPLFFYYQKDLHYCKLFWRSKHVILHTALKIQDYLKQNSLIQEDFSYYEDMGYINTVLGNFTDAKAYYSKALQAALENEEWRKRRALNMLDIIEKNFDS